MRCSLDRSQLEKEADSREASLKGDLVVRDVKAGSCTRSPIATRSPDVMIATGANARAGKVAAYKRGAVRVVVAMRSFVVPQRRGEYESAHLIAPKRCKKLMREPTRTKE